jgi:DEAD/DEAH box helicase domain-containing protein
MEKFFYSNDDWKIVRKLVKEPKEGRFFSIDDLNLSNETKQYLNKNFSKGIYGHQKKAVELFEKNQNICVTTSTASGKSLIFQVCSLETINKNLNSKVMAIYPLKALSHEQYEKFLKINKNLKVGRIDGSVDMSERIKILKNSDIIIFTPDVIHAWLLDNLADKNIIKFFENLDLIIIDEAHLYSGVFGSNSAYVFRRINHIVYLLKNITPQYIAASATVKDPKQHLRTLCGIDFEIINEKFDTSPEYEKEILLVEKSPTKDLLSALSEVFTYIIKETDKNFITFVDSRKQTEYIATISSRTLLEKKAEEENINEALEEMIEKDNSVCPYRSGYEEEDRNIIQEKLNNGILRGIVSTSALEAGIDVPYLDIVILVGIPNSATSIYQRIGRVGRQKKGTIIVINDHSPISNAVFSNKIDFFEIPLQESALYLENHRIQYIHVLCLARENGEHDQVCQSVNCETKVYETKTDFPQSFIELCKKEIAGEISTEFQMIKSQCGDDPNHFYPLRDIDIQYKVVYKSGPNIKYLGILSYSQIMREAYPGAVYYYYKKPYRVYNIDHNKKIVEVRKEKYYTTQPIMFDPIIRPNFSNESILNAVKIDDIYIIETVLQISELISGFNEKRGPNKLEFNYPLNGINSLFYKKKYFARNYFTTGIVIINKNFNNFNNKELHYLNLLLYEAFKITVPFESRDIDFGIDKSRVNKDFITEDDKFLSIYDQTYGSLRLSSKFIQQENIENIANYAIYLYNEQKSENYYPKIENFLNYFYLKITDSGIKPLNFSEYEEISINDDSLIKILLPGSKGLNIKMSNEIFQISDIAYTRHGVMYRGKYPDRTNPRERNTVFSVPIENIDPIPGESEWGYFNIDTGEIIENN